MKKHKLFKATTQLSISTIVFVLSSYLINIILARILGPAQYGLYGVIISLVTVVNIMQTSGIPQATSKYIAEEKNDPHTILKSSLYLQLIFTLFITTIFFLLALPFSLLLKDTKLIPYIQLASFIFPFYGIFTLYSGFYNGLHFFSKQAFIMTLYSISKTFLVLILSFIWGLRGALVGLIIAPAISLVYGFQIPTTNHNSFSYKKLILFAFPLVGFAFLSTLLQTIDLYFIKSLILSDTASGYYTASQNISRIPYFLINSYALVIFPSISKNTSQNLHTNSQKIIRTSLRYIIMILAPITVIISATSKQLVQLIYSNTYLPAAPSLSVLILGMGFLTLFSLLCNILSGSGIPKLSFLLSGLSLIITSTFCFFLIPMFGLNGAALATTIGGFSAMVLAAFLVYRKFQVLASYKSVIKIIIASLGVYFIGLYIDVPPLFLPILYLILFTLYFAMLILMREITWKDWLQIQDILPSQIQFPR